MSDRDKKCKEVVRDHFKSRMDDLRQLWDAYCRGDEECVEGLGRFEDYGLCFDYVAPGTFNDQRRGYFRYQLSWGGPSDEFRFYLDETRRPTRIEYWYLDWFDGAKTTVRSGKNWDLLIEIFASFSECLDFDKMIAEES